MGVVVVTAPILEAIKDAVAFRLFGQVKCQIVTNYLIIEHHNKIRRIQSPTWPLPGRIPNSVICNMIDAKVLLSSTLTGSLSASFELSDPHLTIDSIVNAITTILVRAVYIYRNENRILIHANQVRKNLKNRRKPKQR